MDYYSNDNEVYSNFDTREQKKYLENTKRMDKGHNIIYRKIMDKNNKKKVTKLNVYTSGDSHSKIRDAETGVYYSNLVGTADEDLFFKIILASGECKSKNGSNTLFYLSPRHYMSHTNAIVDEDLITEWQEKRNTREKTKNIEKENKYVKIF